MYPSLWSGFRELFWLYQYIDIYTQCDGAKMALNYSYLSISPLSHFPSIQLTRLSFHGTLQVPGFTNIHGTLQVPGFRNIGSLLTLGCLSGHNTVYILHIQKGGRQQYKVQFTT